MKSLQFPLVALIALAISPSLSLSPQDAVAQSPKQAPGAAPSFDTGQLQAFAEANIELQEIRQNYLPKLRHADDTQAQQTLRRAQGEEMIEAVNDAGLTVDQYNAIHAAYQNNPKVKERVDQLLSQER